MLEYPVWLICGFLVPLDVLPRLGAPDLVGARADLGHERDPRVGRSAARRWPDLPMCVALGAALHRRSASLVLDRVLRAARARAALSLT